MDSRTGYFSASASTRVVYLAITSGRSGKNVMPRKPSASHCVEKLPPDLYRPSSSELSCGRVRVTTSSSNDGAAGGLWRVRRAGSRV